MGYTEEQNKSLKSPFRGCESTWQGTAGSRLKSAVSVWLKFAKSLGGRSFIKPFAADPCCSFSGVVREPGYSTGALAFQKVPAPLAQPSTETLIREIAEDKCAYEIRVGL